MLEITLTKIVVKILGHNIFVAYVAEALQERQIAYQTRKYDSGNGYPNQLAVALLIKELFQKNMITAQSTSSELFEILGSGKYGLVTGIYRLHMNNCFWFEDGKPFYPNLPNHQVVLKEKELCLDLDFDKRKVTLKEKQEKRRK